MVDGAHSGNDLRTLAEDSFELAHLLVALRLRIDKKAGGLLGMFRKIDYNEIDEKARELRAKFASLEERIVVACGTNEKSEFASELRAYAAALCGAADLLAQKTGMMLQLSIRPNSVKLSQFKSVVDEEWKQLEQCQTIGDRLTRMFRRL